MELATDYSIHWDFLAELHMNGRDEGGVTLNIRRDVVGTAVLGFCCLTMPMIHRG